MASLEVLGKIVVMVFAVSPVWRTRFTKRAKETERKQLQLSELKLGSILLEATVADVFTLFVAVNAQLPRLPKPPQACRGALRSVF